MAEKPSFHGTYGTMYYVHDMAKSVAFYKEKFNLAPSFESPEWTEFDLDGHALCLHAHDPRESFQHGGCLITKVSDINGLVASLKGDGIEFVGEVKEVYPGAYSAEFKDPNGNVLSIYEGSVN